MIHPFSPRKMTRSPETRTLRIIDFGSACCMNSWTANKPGYKGENKGPRSILYVYVCLNFVYLVR